MGFFSFTTFFSALPFSVRFSADLQLESLHFGPFNDSFTLLERIFSHSFAFIA